MNDVFFFQAEDGIRDWSVTGVQTCALPIYQQPNAELYDLQASLEEDAGRYVQAVRHYQSAVDLDPGNEQYYFDLAAEYLVHLTFGPALEVFRVASQKFPASARLHVGEGLAQFALRQYGDAADTFMDALETDPTSPDAFLAWNALPTFVIVAAWEKIQPRLRHLAGQIGRASCRERVYISVVAVY